MYPHVCVNHREKNATKSNGDCDSFPGLTRRAEKGTPSRDPDAEDHRPALAAGLPFPPVDPVEFLEFARASVRIGVIADGGPLPPDGLFQDGNHRLMERPQPAAIEAPDRRLGVKARPVKDFVGIDVADAGDKSLVEEKGLEAPPPSREKPGEGLRVEVQGFRTERVEFGR